MGTLITAILAGLALAAVCGFALGYTAAEWLTKVWGSREGAAAMGGFFTFGPIGAVIGFLLGVGLVLRFGGASVAWGNKLMVASGVISVLAGLLLLVEMRPRSSSVGFPFVLEFELQAPAASLGDVPVEANKWIYLPFAPRSTSEDPNSSFFSKKCEGDVCVVQGSSYSPAGVTDPRIVVKMQDRQRTIPLVGMPSFNRVPFDWTDWVDSGDVKVRWRLRRG